ADRHEWSDEIVSWILRRHVIDSVLDVGCGNGAALLKFEEQAIVFGPRFDLVWCTEVLEHIPQAGEDNAVDTLTANADAALFLSAASPGQPGFFHVNCRPKEYWVDRICERGFRYVPQFDAVLGQLPDDGPFG